LRPLTISRTAEVGEAPSQSAELAATDASSNDADFGEGDFGGFSEVQPQSAAAAPSASDFDDFGGFSEAEPQSAVAISASDDFDDFGGFSEAQPPSGGGGDDDFDDFGGFSEAAGASVAEQAGDDDDSFGAFGGVSQAVEAAPQTTTEVATIAPAPASSLLTSAAFDGDEQVLKLAASQVLTKVLPMPTCTGAGTGTDQTLSQSSCRLDQLLCEPAQDPALADAAWQTSSWLAHQPSYQDCMWDGSLLEKGFLDALGLPRGAVPANESAGMASSGVTEHTSSDAPVTGSVAMASLGSSAQHLAASRDTGADDAFDGFGDFGSPVAKPNAPENDSGFPALARVDTDLPAVGAPPPAMEAAFGSFAGGHETASTLAPPAPVDDLMGIFGGTSAPSSSLGAGVGQGAPLQASDAFGDFVDPFATASASVPQVTGPPAPTVAGLLDLGFFGDAAPIKQADDGAASLLNSTMAQFGMADMLASLESLEGPSPRSGGGSATDAWLATLPDLAWVFSAELKRPTAAVH